MEGSGEVLRPGRSRLRGPAGGIAPLAALLAVALGTAVAQDLPHPVQQTLFADGSTDTTLLVEGFEGLEEPGQLPEGWERNNACWAAILEADDCPPYVEDDDDDDERIYFPGAFEHEITGNSVYLSSARGCLDRGPAGCWEDDDDEGYRPAQRWWTDARLYSPRLGVEGYASIEVEFRYVLPLIRDLVDFFEWGLRIDGRDVPYGRFDDETAADNCADYCSDDIWELVRATIPAADWGDAEEVRVYWRFSNSILFTSGGVDLDEVVVRGQPDPPAAPDKLKAKDRSPSQIDLTWRDNADNEDGFAIERRTGSGGWTEIDRVDANVEAYTDEGLAAGTRYCYRVRAYNAGGESPWSNEDCATTPGGAPDPPAAPSALEAQGASSSRIDVSWRDNADDEEGFHLERRRGGTSSWSRIATLPANTTSYEDDGLAADTEYCYRVRAYNAGGESPWSNEDCARTDPPAPDPPAAPSALEAQGVSSSRIDVSWRDNADDEEGFHLERRRGGTSSWSRIATLPANTTSYEDDGLAADTEYCYRVRAYNEADPSPWSNEDCARTAAPGEPWVQRSAAQPPPARRRHAAAFDRARGRMVVFGGENALASGEPATTFSDTWEWDGQSWRRRDVAPPPVSPGERPVMAYDASRRVAVLHTVGETWEWDGSRWASADPGGTAPDLGAGAMVYDAGRRVIVAWSAAGGTHEYDGTRWRSVPTAQAPPPRADPAFAYDDRRGVAVLFGGSSGGELRADTWEYDGNDWRRRTPPLAPPPRARAAAAYDPDRDEVVLYGGYGGATGARGDTWLWNGSAWRQEDAGGALGGRFWHTVVFDGVRGLPVLFAGATGTNGGESDQLWEYGRRETCDGDDDDGDGVVDDRCDPDGDDWCDARKPLVGDPAVCPAGGGDCDEDDPSRNPGAADVCDGRDNDCDPVTPDGSAESWWNDACDGQDADLCLEGREVCEDGARVCTDTTGSTSEVCNGDDDDCDGAIDEGFDADGDAVADCFDNCAATPNASQADFDGDGLGDACETEPRASDINRSERIDGFDLAALARAFGSREGDAHYDPGADLDRDGWVDGDDLAILARHFGDEVE